MSNEGLKKIKELKFANKATLNTELKKNNEVKVKKEASPRPSNQLEGSLLGWYSVLSSYSLNENKLYSFSMFNEPLIIYRDNDSNIKCIKDLCPHRGSSFIGGEIKDGELVCPYHGARFSSKGNCTNIDRITCNHIVDTNYDNYAKKIHLYQYPCIERDGYIYIYYTGKAKTDINEFNIESKLEQTIPDTYGFNISEYEHEEVTVDFKADWVRIIENHLDILHIFWVHGETIPDKDVSKNVITSFDQEIIRDKYQIQSKYNHKDKDKGEFITIKFIPPGRVMIYKGAPETSRYVQVLDHIPLAQNRARVIVRHYRKFLKNKLLNRIIMFRQLQHKLFYQVFKEDYLILRTQTFNHQMGYIEKDNVKLLGEDKMVQYYWDWLQNAFIRDKPWELHPTTKNTNSIHEDMGMLYPPENPSLAIKNMRSIRMNTLIRALIPIGFIILLI
ncbi:aromatic ring-hydroxylating dioxygenase subunit alpha [Prochlorococcus sp. MIT 1223]|uniref:aromatic ring-hydroxylating dioxygenase subunit alpha n=1 Tax=Prochlorococcus sp. MIT 1223 TaxID=3096217 RepID=UPI002A752D73|nr:aromatic ring-hydroxylating dioxygenase subunit alpha [Prochlorococcus sp. MIT 1223]